MNASKKQSLIVRTIQLYALHALYCLPRVIREKLHDLENVRGRSPFSRLFSSHFCPLPFSRQHVPVWGWKTSWLLAESASQKDEACILFSMTGKVSLVNVNTWTPKFRPTWENYSAPRSSACVDFRIKIFALRRFWMYICLCCGIFANVYLPVPLCNFVGIEFRYSYKFARLSCENMRRILLRITMVIPVFNFELSKRNL